MSETESKGTLGILIDELIRAETCGRDFHLAMLEAFIYVPAVADVWRELMVEEGIHLNRLREFHEELNHETAIQPVDSSTIEQAKRVPTLLDEARIRAIETLEDAFLLLSDYENCGHHHTVELIAEVTRSAAVALPPTHHREPHGRNKLMGILRRFGSKEMRQFVVAIKARGNRICGMPRPSLGWAKGPQTNT